MCAQQTSHELPPEAKLQGLLSGFLVTQMLAVSARLGIADQLAKGPCHHEKLAKDLNVSPAALYRLLRALASHGVFSEDVTEPGVFSLTPVADLLRTEVPGSQRIWAMLHGSEWFWASVGHMPYSISSGGPAFKDIYGTGTFQYFAREPHHGELFFAAMNQVTELILPALLAVYDFSPFQHAIDIGGGLGSLVAAVLHNQPSMNGTLFDLPYMVEPAKAYLAGQGLASRCEVVAGDFFDGVPEGGDVHLLKWIIHDWNDEQAIAILRNSRKSIQPGGRLLLIEQVIADGNTPCPSKMMDMVMLLMEQGRERREDEFAAIFSAAGYRLNQRIPLLGPWSAIEAIPV